jgi:UDP-3-O-[3-hydroxymyristoyl] glucosamine N-acyltransferase
MAMTLGEIAVRFGLELSGDPAIAVTGVGSLAEATPGEHAFCTGAKYRKDLAATRATAVVLPRELAAGCPAAALLSARPYAAFARIAQALHPLPAVTPGRARSAEVAESARVAASAWLGAGAVVGGGAEIGERCFIGPHCVIEEGARLGDDCRLQAGVTVCRGVVIGKRCTAKAGAVIGGDGFGFAPDVDGYVKVPHVGTARLGDDVDVGANTTIDRGTIGDTVIGDGVKLDNQVQVGHNCRIGAHTVIAGCVGISGSSIIGSRCMIGGAVGIAGHLEIGDGVVVTGYSLVTHSLPGPGMYSSGMPAIEARKWRRAVARLHRLDARGRGGGEGKEP